MSRSLSWHVACDELRLPVTECIPEVGEASNIGMPGQPKMRAEEQKPTIGSANAEKGKQALSINIGGTNVASSVTRISIHVTNRGVAVRRRDRAKGTSY
jgi:hypothetical protein